jgi:hypothetical protein
MIIDLVIKVVLKEDLWKQTVFHLLEIMDLVAKDLLEEVGLEGLREHTAHQLLVVQYSVLNVLL